MEFETVSVKDFAKAAGVSTRAIHEAIKSGRIKSVTKNGRGYSIEKDKALMEFAMNTDQKTRLRKYKQDESAAETDKEFISIGEAERREKVFKAKLAEQKFEEQAGLLVRVEEVEKEAFEVARRVRDNLLNIPTRISGELLGNDSQEEIEKILEKEIRTVLEELARYEKN
jgi:predicted site-specific integrase-resolvase